MSQIRYSLFLLFLLWNAAEAFTQTQNIQLNSYGIDEKARKMQSIIAVYKYNGQPFEDPALLGIQSKEPAHTFFARLPDLTGVKDTSYAYFYFGGISGNPNLSGYVLAIITNNTRNSKPCLIWVDRNYNLNLTDDGPPDTFYFNTQHLDLKFEHPSVKGASLTTRISRFPFTYNPKYLGMLDDYYRKNSGKKIFSGSTYIFKEERLNVKAGDVVFGKDSFRVALKDMNCNGIFNEPGVDAVLTGAYKEPVLTDELIPISEKTGKTFFEKNGRHYDITYLDPLGASISLSLDTGARIRNSLVAGKKIKKFRFNVVDTVQKSISIKKFRKKQVYLYVWRFGEKDFDRDTAALREIALHYSHKINVVTLNYGETPKELRLFKNRNHINWLMGMSSTKINKQLFIENYPTGILTKKRLRISRVGISPSELLDLLKNNRI